MDRLTEKRLQSHIDECNHRINKINDFILNNVDANQEECANNIAVLVNAVNAIEEYKKYKILEEQGKLLKPPCSVGDTVYTIYSDEDVSFIEEQKVEEVSTHRIWIDSVYFDYDDFGKTVFLTKEGAEAALKELEDKNA